MEIGLQNDIPTYSGGLGILAGDTLRAAADMDLPLIAVTLVHREGYFSQSIVDGIQVEQASPWKPQERLESVPNRVTVTLEGKDVQVQAWRYVVEGLAGQVPVYLLDTDIPENPEEFRGITNQLYGGDLRMRLLQESVLGLGGVAILHALGHDCETYHMNEGHSALLGLALIEHHEPHGEEALKQVRKHCVFTTHTPVPAGHDKFPMDMVRGVLGDARAETLLKIGCGADGTLNMTDLALRVSRYVNGVAMRHRDISRLMFPNYMINSITNGVHAATWTSPEFREVFDRNIPEWRAENFNLRYAVAINLEEIRTAHRAAKEKLLTAVTERTGKTLSPDVFTIGFARRATPYKRADMLFMDPERLRKMASEMPVQILYAGKAHPHDQGGKEIISRIHDAASKVAGDVEVVYLQNYDMDLGALLVAGVDLWLNTPQKPQEASGTSGMKAALNGVPSLSVLDGWWIEGHVEGVTGWSIGTHWESESDTAAEAVMLYDQLENVILPMYYKQPEEYAKVMCRSIALNGSFFTAQRMVLQYALRAYELEATAVAR
jgi:starch phosphorylase